MHKLTFTFFESTEPNKLWHRLNSKKVTKFERENKNVLKLSVHMYSIFIHILLFKEKLKKKRVMYIGYIDEKKNQTVLHYTSERTAELLQNTHIQFTYGRIW